MLALYPQIQTSSQIQSVMQVAVIRTIQRMLCQVSYEGTDISLPVRGWWIQGRRSVLL